MSFVRALRCRECGREYPVRLQAGCESCFAPLEVDYNYDAIAASINRDKIESRPANIWKFQELLPLEDNPRVGLDTGGTPLVRADRLAKKLGLDVLYLKNDSVSFPTLSFKDRVTAVAVNKAIEFNLEAVGCASTGNLANSVAAQAAAGGLPSFVLIPESLERNKITATQIYGARVLAVRGNYDEVNRLCSQIADRYPWGFVNVNLRPFYAEGSKTMAFEIAEQLGWRAPDAVVVPMAGGSLLSKIQKGLMELKRVGLLAGPLGTRLFGAQASGCNPIVDAVRRRSTDIRPVKPNTIAKSLAIGNPADGYYASELIQKSGGFADDASDTEISSAIQLLAEMEGIYTETAGGVTIAVLKKLADRGLIDRTGVTVAAITGNGLKTPEAVALSFPEVIDPRIDAFEKVLKGVANVA